MPGPNYGLAKGMIVDSAATNVKVGRACAQTGTSNQTVTTAGAAADVFGIFIDEYGTGMDAAKIATGKATIGVAVWGIVRVEAGAAITRRARLITDSSGRSVAATKAAAGAQPAFTHGIALSAAAQAGDMVDCLLTPGALF
jgi:hypothetical protein